MFQGPAIALLELESIARGYLVADAAVKRAPVRLLMTEPVTPGKYLVLFDGEVADVEEAYAEALEIAGPGVVDKLLLTQASLALAPAISGQGADAEIESLGIVETATVSAALLAADTALKAAEVALLKMHLARGIGGKGYFVLTGSLDMVEAAVSSAAAIIAPELLVNTELIARPHPDFAPRAR
ncbi:MAG: BMC domain-containing protein [Myxococcales bacterium]